MALLGELWSMREGISECWWLSRRCVVNWDAWSAVGTVAAVFAAIFAPMIHRAFVRKKANALFALAYRGDILMVLIRLKNLKDDYPMSQRNDAAWAVEAILSQDAKLRESFVSRAKSLDALSARDLDLTKWPAADLGLASKIAVAMESVRHFQVGALILGNPSEVGDWEGMLNSMAEVLDRAIADVQSANDAISAAIRALRKARKPPRNEA